MLAIRRFWPALVLGLLVCFVLAGCGKTVNLSEKRIDGIDSQITIALPGKAHELPLPVALDPLTQRYLKGQRFYGEINQGLNIGIYTSTIDANQMYSDLGLDNGQDISYRLSQNIENAATAILNKIDAENISVKSETTSVSGEHAVLQTFTFTAGDKRMKAKLLGFSHNGATWIILVACDVESENVSAIDGIIESVHITK